jgi:hypothetical protein
MSACCCRASGLDRSGVPSEGSPAACGMPSCHSFSRECANETLAVKMLLAPAPLIDYSADSAIAVSWPSSYCYRDGVAARACSGCLLEVQVEVEVEGGLVALSAYVAVRAFLA